jgi:hypothetical protein
MKRFPDWQLRLERFARARRGEKFSWGENDCALFAADAVEALTGERVAQALRGHQTAREALRTLAAVGGIRGLATRALGEPIPVLQARIGDVVVIPTGKREALAVCNGGTALAAGVNGIAVVPIQQALAAWRVG